MIVRRSKLPIVHLLLLLTTAGVGCGPGDAEPSGTSATTRVEPSTTTSEARPELDDLANIPISEPPQGMVFDAEDLGDDARKHLLDLSPPEVAEAVQVGWVDAVLRQYWSPNFMEDVFSGSTIPSRRFERSGYWTVLSGAALYESPGTAEAALGVYVEDYSASWGLREVGQTQLGNGGAIFKGPNPVGGAPQIVIIWTTGPYLLNVVATGSIEADADEIQRIAEGMESRAEGASPG
jgi:hypothetical protein